ncbi:hypothetical protein K3G63_21990 [Hymenobacter sp. HSC-4F20]|uniref:hypothetical protein n=1 Tax=Hymenobacter sp. HSC-4F20 TaxID=2864135 RepID=UPI001C73C985|nr:hypothetical protein [Hymenobacter sp. HSC-4F20]MBX0293132.1 hypothetical protein [Hymenobacter sp. HSC-4F20]
MRTLELSPQHSLRFYQSIMELPAGRHMEYQCYMALDAGVGSTPEDVERHTALSARFGARKGKEYEEFLEKSNAHYAQHFVEMNYSPRRLAFAVLVETVDGVPTTDITEHGLESLFTQLTVLGLTDELINKSLASVREAFGSELAEHFPSRYDQDGSEINKAVQLKRRGLAMCNYLLDQDPKHLKTIEDVDNALLDMMEPEVFETGHPENALVMRRIAFSQLCGVLADHGTPEPEKMTLFQFQARIDYITKKMASKNKSAE